ncbi:MAG: phytanoyl-CoA dioxygenase family protein [Chloroflexi bacterium]|nr:phytanoyl-CoA dioxygenase family protein [Chloroflexota bacterium]MBV9547688.1 phytanoyl-CoA dioxygenase family protein [Chloroflexota bacterium]
MVLHVSSRPASELSPAEQRAFYEEQGYLVFPQLLDPAELATLRNALAEVLREAEGLTENNDKFSITKTDDGGYSVRRIYEPIVRHEAFRALVHNPKILDVVEALIGPNIQLHHTKLNLKPPSSREARFEWHQDYPFFPHTNFDLLAVMIYLDDSTEENGCLTIIPGSHKFGPRNHLFARDGAFSSQLEDKAVLNDPSRWLKVPVPAGGMELHHCNMLHSSTANRGTKPRSAMVIQYRAADNVALGGNMSNAGFGLQVRGENPYRVRMIEGTFKLPGKIEDPLQRDG